MAAKAETRISPEVGPKVQFEVTEIPQGNILAARLPNARVEMRGLVCLFFNGDPLVFYFRMVEQHEFPKRDEGIIPGIDKPFANWILDRPYIPGELGTLAEKGPMSFSKKDKAYIKKILGSDSPELSQSYRDFLDVFGDFKSSKSYEIRHQYWAAVKEACKEKEKKLNGISTVGHKVV